MSDNYMTPLSLILSELRERGYSSDFELIGGLLISKQTDEFFKPGDLVIERVYRFEGDSNPDDMAVMYAIRSSTGTLGVVIDAYGVYDNDELGDFFGTLNSLTIINSPVLFLSRSPQTFL